jgi:hypothetical protein
LADRLTGLGRAIEGNFVSEQVTIGTDQMNAAACRAVERFVLMLRGSGGVWKKMLNAQFRRWARDQDWFHVCKIGWRRYFTSPENYLGPSTPFAMNNILIYSTGGLAFGSVRAQAHS